MATIGCTCGAVQGVVADASPRTANRVICYCADCQAFAHHLGRADLLDAHGGSDIVQVAPGRLTFVKGQERLEGLRLSPKGLHRWYAACCRMPMGNTVGPHIPFVGLMAQCFNQGDQDVDEIVGPPVGAILGRYAIGEVPEAAQGMPAGLVVRTILKVIGWRLAGAAWPNPFFVRKTGEAIYPVHVVSKDERMRLRDLCGPKPTSTQAPASR